MLDLLAEAGFCHLSGLDLNPPTAVPGKKSAWQFLQGSALKLPFEENSFDWILCAHALHHLPDYRNIAQLLQEAWRCLRPGGRLALVDHYDSPWLRLAFGLLSSPLAELTAWSSAFRKQLAAEIEPLTDYLNHWHDAEKMIRQSPFGSTELHKDLFFFYFSGRK